ncbi:MAG: 6,7-dimethyl-8-ribityllumazine synthase [Gammaproteobacteria bacterium]|nr:6,7-dimethyl-8-ribityllumazine synthase [Gammaproteobacteria bacterium]
MTAINKIEAKSLVTGNRVAIVASRYNNFIVDRLLEGCLTTLKAGGIEDKNITLVTVPGAFEIPVAVKALADKTESDAIITLGAIIRGETPHFDIIAEECTRGIGSIAIDSGLPVVFGVLTVDNVEQAMDRSGAEESNKGSEAATTALEMISVLGQISG